MVLHQKIHHIFHNLLRKMFQAIGHDIYRGEFKPYTLTFIMYGLFSIFVIGAIYTLTQYDMTTALNITLWSRVRGILWKNRF